MQAQAKIEDQAALWNGTAGQAWVDAQALLDDMFRPFEALLAEAVAARAAPARRVLDVGCGTGSTTRALARRLGPKAHCVGVDISQPMIAAARDLARQQELASTTEFICADAQRHAFEPGSFDAIVSRFGVMFFDDAVRAFMNLRHAARTNAGLCFIAWRSAAENPFMTAAERAAAPLLPSMPARQPNAPGQFGFADERRVGQILAQSGWTDVGIQALDVVCTLPEKDLLTYLSRLGPLGRVLHLFDERTRRQVVEVARAAFDPFVHGQQVRYTAACWMVSARAPAAS